MYVTVNSHFQYFKHSKGSVFSNWTIRQSKILIPFEISVILCLSILHFPGKYANARGEIPKRIKVFPRKIHTKIFLKTLNRCLSPIREYV